MTQDFDVLEPEQAQLLADIVRAYRERRDKDFRPEMDGIKHPGLEGGLLPTKYADLMVLEKEGFLHRVTSTERGGIDRFIPSQAGINRAEQRASSVAAPGYVLADATDREQALVFIDTAKQSIDTGDVPKGMEQFIDELTRKLDELRDIIGTEWPTAEQRVTETERAKSGVGWLRGAVESVKFLGALISGVANGPKAVENIEKALPSIEGLQELIAGIPVG